MIAELALAAALTLTAPVDDVQLPMCAPGEEAVPFEDGYACGPADPVLPEPLPTFTAQPAPVSPAPEPPPTAEPAPVTAEPSPAPAVPEPPRLAETGVVEDRLWTLAYAGVLIVSLGLGVLAGSWLGRAGTADVRNRHRTNLRDEALFDALSTPAIPGERYPGMRDENGYYTTLKSTDTGYPYGAPDGPAGSSSEQSGDHPLSIREELRNRHGSPLPVAPVDLAGDRNQRVPDDVELDTQHLAGTPVSIDQILVRLLRLQQQTLHLLHEIDSHDASPSVLDDEGAISSSSDQTVGETADTAAIGSMIPFGSQRTVGGCGAAASSGPAAPHSDLEGEQQ